MAEYTLFVHVMPRAGVLDPPGEATRAALAALGFDEVREVRIGRRVALTLEAGSLEEARERARTMAERLLANPVIESFELAEGGHGPARAGTGGAERP